MTGRLASDLQGRGISERYPAPHRIRLAGDREPARLRKLPTWKRDHVAARPLIGSEPGMQAGRGAPVTVRPVAAWVPAGFHCSTRVTPGPLLV